MVRPECKHTPMPDDAEVADWWVTFLRPIELARTWALVSPDRQASAGHQRVGVHAPGADDQDGRPVGARSAESVRPAFRRECLRTRVGGGEPDS